MASIAALPLDLALAHRQVDIVMHNYEVLSRPQVPLAQRGHGFSTGIHIGLRLHQHDPLPVYTSDAIERLCLALIEGDVMRFGKQIDDIKTNVVAAMLVTLPGIAESNDDMHAR